MTSWLGSSNRRITFDPIHVQVIAMNILLNSYNIYVRTYICQPTYMQVRIVCMYLCIHLHMYVYIIRTYIHKRIWLEVAVLIVDTLR